jgi:choline dehydrogenase-like flavoprotein
MQALGMEAYRTPQAVITADHAPSGRRVPPLQNQDALGPKMAYVNRYGDALDYKSSTWVSLLRPISKQPNFALWPNCNVTHLEADGSRITRVHFRDESGRRATVVSGH